MKQTIAIDALEEIKKITGSIERNCLKIGEHTWKVYKQQILSHVEDLKNANEKALTEYASIPKEGLCCGLLGGSIKGDPIQEVCKYCSGGPIASAPESGGEEELHILSGIPFYRGKLPNNPTPSTSSNSIEEEKEIEKWVEDEADKYLPSQWMDFAATIPGGGKSIHCRQTLKDFKAGAISMYDKLKDFVPNKSNSDVTPVEYWKKRCELAEYLLAPDAHKLQPQFDEWQKMKKEV